MKRPIFLKGQHSKLVHRAGSGNHFWDPARSENPFSSGQEGRICRPKGMKPLLSGHLETKNGPLKQSKSANYKRVTFTATAPCIRWEETRPCSAKGVLTGVRTDTEPGQEAGTPLRTAVRRLRRKGRPGARRGNGAFFQPSEAPFFSWLFFASAWAWAVLNLFRTIQPMIPPITKGMTIWIPIRR